MPKVTVVVGTRQRFLNELTYGTKRGDWIVYHTGFLMWDRDIDNQFFTNEKRAIINKLADAVYKAYEEGKVELLQKRVDPRYGCDYIAVKA
jgi:hydrogenase maturation factor